jgi:protein-disulfide isomerase
VEAYDGGNVKRRALVAAAAILVVGALLVSRSPRWALAARTGTDEARTSTDATRSETDAVRTDTETARMNSGAAQAAVSDRLSTSTSAAKDLNASNRGDASREMSGETPREMGRETPAETESSASSRETERSASAAADLQGSGVSDVDPHEALGSKNAPIVMEVFSDFQCPACKTLFTTTNRQLMDNYVSTGKVYLIHRDFPLPMHAHSRVAAQYSRAAAQIGKLEAVEEVLFQTQETWEQSGDVDGTVAKVLSPGEMTKVRALVKGGTLDPAINKDQTLGNGYKVNQTPTTIIHAKGQTFPVVGVVSYDVLHQFLDQLLGQ